MFTKIKKKRRIDIVVQATDSWAEVEYRIAPFALIEGFRPSKENQRSKE
jgi:hypothetical protein